MNYINKLACFAVVMICGILTDCHDGNTTLPGLLIAPINRMPVANAGADQRVSVLKGSVDLDGSKSYDPDGKDLAFSWTVKYQPSGSAVSFSHSSGKTTSFTFDMAGTYEIMVTVNDGSHSMSDMVTVDVAVNSGPAAHAGSDREVTAGDTVTLDGSDSSDPEHDPITYTWTQIYGPKIGMGTLTGAAPSFVAPSEVCTIAYDLRVDDGSGDSFADRVYIYIMKKAGSGFHVATTGDDAYEGTRTRPMKTITAAIVAARTAGSDVYVSAGTYNESVTLANGVSIYGGFDPSTWVRDSFKSSDTPSFTTSLQGGAIAMDGNGVTSVVIDGISVTSANAVVSGEGSYAVRLINSTVELKNCIITSGNGALGDNGENTSDSTAIAMEGGDGGNGIKDIGLEWQPPAPPGGIGGVSGNNANGGTGGTNYALAGYGLDKNGIEITPGGQGGEGGEVYEGITTNEAGDGSIGNKGSDGAQGINGPGGKSGLVNVNIWITSHGTDGGVGDPGNGGGGGGAGGSQDVYYWSVLLSEFVPILPLCGQGGSGGGGGAGGNGGNGGKGGRGGGASFGVFLVESTVTLKYCVITSGQGGQGGSGGSGGAGDIGGPGGAGGDDDDSDEVGAGGDGGNGGRGGTGGKGGGGAGGPSFAIYKHGWSSGVIQSGSTLIHGSGGSGGLSGGASSGATGECGYIGGAQ